MNLPNNNQSSGGVLSNIDIEKAIKDKEIKIKGFRPIYIGSSSIDLHLGNRVNILMLDGKHWAMDTRDKKTLIFKEYRFKRLVIYPDKFYLVSTKESITFGNSITGFLQGRSSLARLGLNVHCAGFFDVGFSGTATLELTNFTKKPIILYEGMRICQMVFVKTISPSSIPYYKKKDAKYNKQINPEKSKIYEDK